MLDDWCVAGNEIGNARVNQAILIVKTLIIYIQGLASNPNINIYEAIHVTAPPPSPLTPDNTYFVDTLQWRHRERDGVSNHQPDDCLLNRLFRHRSKKTPKLRVTGLCEGNSPVTGDRVPRTKGRNVENVSIWWRHNVYIISRTPCIRFCVVLRIQVIYSSISLRITSLLPARS